MTPLIISDPRGNTSVSHHQETISIRQNGDPKRSLGAINFTHFYQQHRVKVSFLISQRSESTGQTPCILTRPPDEGCGAVYRRPTRSLHLIKNKYFALDKNKHFALDKNKHFALVGKQVFQRVNQEPNGHKSPQLFFNKYFGPTAARIWGRPPIPSQNLFLWRAKYTKTGGRPFRKS